MRAHLMDAIGLAMFLPSISGAEPWTLKDVSKGGIRDLAGMIAYGSPITKSSPAFTEGTKPSEPTRAAAPSLVISMFLWQQPKGTYEMISPYKLGATATSKILMYKYESAEMLSF